MGFGSLAYSQDYTVNLLKGMQSFEANIKDFDASSITNKEVWNERAYRYLQFYAIPTDAQKADIEAKGVRLLQYIPNFTYIASIPTEISSNDLEELNIRSIQSISDFYKVGQRITDKNYPEWSLTKFGTIRLSISFYDDVTFNSAAETLKQEGIRITESLAHANMAFVEVNLKDIDALLDFTFIEYIDIMPDPGKPESDDGRNLHRSNAINGDYYGARKYDGTGVTISINDDGYVGPHIDFKGRLNQNDVQGDFVGNHGDMVAGIAGGAGNLNPVMRGMAPGSFMHIRQYVSSMSGTIPLHTNDNVLVFSSSYSNGCNAGYTNTTVLVDQEIYNNPNLLQVFSAGNSNSNDCGYGAGSEWGNITGGHKMGKNVIATANLENDDNIRSSSSRGPASDGRIKPDISAHGAGQMSTDPNNGYSPGGGTSAAAPGITGVVAQLHQAYTELNFGQIANSGLLKATIMNTANDLGNVGPDFIYGFGKVNALRAIKLIEENRFVNDNISQGGVKNHSIPIPTGVTKVRVMVYWTDKEGSTSAATALVNDLDAVLTDPSNGTHLPWILDHTPSTAALATPATTGIDHLNNVEQIAIINPAAGIYDLEISGTTIPFGPQEYYVLYEFIMNDITVTYPIGGEGIIPGSNDRIHWDAYGNSGTFALEYTENGGGSWTTISSNVSGGTRIYDWSVPNIISGEVRVRVSRGGETDENDENFSIIERPQNLNIRHVCQNTNTIELEWDTVAGATEYDIFMLGQEYMDSIGSATTTDFNVIVPDVSVPQWFTVRASGPNGLRSNRQIAINFTGAGIGGNCYLSCVSDIDAGISALSQPITNFQTCSGNTDSDVIINLENIGLITGSSIPVYYQLDNGSIVSETFNGSLAPGTNVTYTFASQVSFPGSGTYMLKTWTGLSGDLTACNDTIEKIITVSNSITNFPLNEDFEGTFPPNTAQIVNPDNDLTWKDVITTGSDGASTTASYINNFSYNVTGQEDEMRFVNFDMSNVQNPSTAILTFDVAYREYSSSFTDDLRIDVSNDCGLTFNEVYFKDGPDLATGPNSSANWEPADNSDWRNDTVNLSAYTGGDVIVRFVNICGYGNNLFIDNVNINVQSTASVNELNNLDLKLMPNPARNEATVKFAQPLTEKTKVSIIGMDGKIVWEESLSRGTQQKTIDVRSLSTAVYTIRFTSDAGTTFRKIVIKG